MIEKWQEPPPPKIPKSLRMQIRCRHASVAGVFLLLSCLTDSPPNSYNCSNLGFGNRDDNSRQQHDYMDEYVYGQ